jgi:hypothetical protein
LPNRSSDLSRFVATVRALEARMMAWPLWKKSVVLIPAFLVLSVLLVLFIYEVGAGLAAIAGALFGR